MSRDILDQLVPVHYLRICTHITHCNCLLFDLILFTDFPRTYVKHGSEKFLGKLKVYVVRLALTNNVTSSMGEGRCELRCVVVKETVGINDFVFILCADYTTCIVFIKCIPQVKCHWVFRILIKVVLQRCLFHVQDDRLSDIFLRTEIAYTICIIRLFLLIHKFVLQWRISHIFWWFIQFK